jgi:DNA polymerase-1
VDDKAKSMVDKAKSETGAKQPVYLLDSMGFIFRAYHAMQRSRPMSTRSGIPTAATYVFVNMINKLRRDFSPEYFAAVFDLSGPVFRDEQAKALTTIRRFNIRTQKFDEIDYAGYKANRPSMPEDLVQQLPYIRRALEAFRIPIIAYEGFEADDVIGTLARKAAADGHKVFIVTSDKDMMQLVNDDVVVLNPAKDNLILDRAGVEQALGVEPEKVIDVMALRGDAVDNVPGAPGIGDKGSVELIQQYGSVEAALDHAAEVKRKTYRESLENNRETILLSKELVTIHTGVPVDLDLQAMHTQPVDAVACRQLFGELEFTSMLKELGSEPEPKTGSSSDRKAVEYLTDPTAEQVAECIAAASKNGMALVVGSAVAVSEMAEDSESADVAASQQGNLMLGAEETTSESTQKAGVDIGLAAEELKGLRVHLHDADSVEVRKALEEESVPKSVHDLKSALRMLADEGIALRGARHDVMLYSYLINPTHGSHKLADVCARFGEGTLSQQGEAQLPEAALAVLRLAPKLRREVEKNETLRVYEEIDLPLAPVLERMERAGVRVDAEVLREMSTRLAVEINALTERIYKESGQTESGQRFNINSPKQLGEVLFNKMGLPKPTKQGKGKVTSTAVDVLEELAEQHIVPRLVLEYRQLAKLKSTYLDSLPLMIDPHTQRVHTTFNQVGTATGRLSSVNPNLQNIPVRTALGREIRAAFVASPGCVILSADYSQIELRLMAHFSRDPLLLRAYRENQDIHTLTAAEVFGVDASTMDKETRNRAKAVNFGIVYGISPFGLAAQLGIEQKKARAYIDKYFERYSGVRRFIDETLEAVRKTQSVRTLFGRVRPIPDILSGNANLRGFAERTAINTPLQGTAADLIKLAMIRIDAALQKKKFKTLMTLQVHDELLFDAPVEEADAVRALVREEMEHVVELSVPIVADVNIGPNWRDAK